MNDENTPIFANSLNRLIIIDKEEYYLSYKHSKIENYSDTSVLNTNLDIGKFYLTAKYPDKTGNIIQYVSDEKSMVIILI